MNGREKGSGLTFFLGMLLIVLLVAAAVLSGLQQIDRRTKLAAAEILNFGNQGFDLSLRAKSASEGEAKSFTDLQRFKGIMASVDRVEEAAVAAEVADAPSLRRAWSQIIMGLDELLARKDAVVTSADAALRARQLVERLRSNFNALAGSVAPAQVPRYAPVLEQLKTQLLVIDQQLDRLASTSSVSAVAADITAATEIIRQTVAALTGEESMTGVPVMSGDAALLQLNEMTSGVAQLAEVMRTLEDAGGRWTEARRAAAQIAGASNGMYAATVGVRNSIENNEQSVWRSWYLLLGVLGGALLSALWYMVVTRKTHVGRADIVAVEAGSEQTDNHQEAILRLLDEMGNLADGDLTVEATVTEDITGAIADSINYAIEALRELVSTIDGAAESVDSAARQTEAAANHLARASENQSRQVSSATESITKMATSIEQVSGDAERSSEVARHSVEIAHKGGEAVRRTIDGMNTIRETIQDTSKRIKRLGESSQEIGNIVELINDIAEQTNILALNASIQASMAGEAGRGFAVVADEVQRLAERSTSATKQIEVLVKTIQSDTNEAVVSMERSTTDVVSGSLLAENAGAALDEIEKVSNQIASLVQNISGMGRQQAMAAADVTRNMGVLQEISAQTADNTSATSQSIGKLAEMASLMRRSVAGFTLPREAESSAAEVDDEMLSELAAEKNEFIDSLIVSERNST